MAAAPTTQLDHLFKELFGDDDDGNDPSTIEHGRNCSIEHEASAHPASNIGAPAVAHSPLPNTQLHTLVDVPGLVLLKGFLNTHQQAHYLEKIESEDWFTGGTNQAMRFGQLPSWAEALGRMVPTSLLPQEVGIGIGGDFVSHQALFKVFCSD